MFSFISTKTQYAAVEDADFGELKVEGSSPYVVRSRNQLNIGRIIGLGALCCVTGASIYTIYQGNFQKCSALTATTGAACENPAVRREWRTLSQPEKNDYVQAVQCLSTKPSKLQANGTMYDDFPFVHKETASTAHKSAPFLPWHRYYIYAYEQALKNECHYTASLPYWDWSQDWNDFENSPIWSAVSGFGGNGAGELTVGEGACVTDGPFAGLEARYYDGNVQPHCLSRGFTKGEKMAELGELISPNAIAEILREKDFAKFSPKLEVRAHKFISESIKGDFSSYTGPYDPVFFLHHANLDRLWTKWQAAGGASAYAGKASMYSDAPAQRTNMLDVGGLLPQVAIADVMETTSGMFCYTY